MEEALLFLFKIVLLLVIKNDKVSISLDDEDYQKLCYPECYFELTEEDNQV